MPSFALCPKSICQMLLLSAYTVICNLGWARQSFAEKYSPEHPVVQEMVQKGVAFLSSSNDGLAGEGVNVLAGYTIFKVNGDPEHPVVVSAVKEARNLAASFSRNNAGGLNSLYVPSLAGMLLASIDVDAHGVQIRQIRDFLLRSQKRNGGFGYLTGELDDSGDISQTQYVMLSLWTMSQLGIEIPDDPVVGAINYMVAAQTSKFLSIGWQRPTSVYSHTTVVLVASQDAIWAALNASWHTDWVVTWCSSLENRLRYLPSDGFETFPFPPELDSLESIGARYDYLRRAVMSARREGLTATYNRFHSPDEGAPDIEALRGMHLTMDNAVAAAYGWTDLDLGHGFHETKQGVRFTISEAARREVLQRLLKLNHERYAEEVKQGLHRKSGEKGVKSRESRSKSASKPGSATPTFFGMDEDEANHPQVSEIETVQAEQVKSNPRSILNIAASTSPVSTTDRPTPIDKGDADDIMAAFRQAARGRGSMDRDELLKEVSLILGYQRLGPRIEEALRGQLRAAIRRRIIEPEGTTQVRAGTTSMADYELEELRESFRSVMRKGTSYEREDILHALARYLGFARLTDPSREALKSAINSAIRQGILGYEGSSIWRE